MSALAALVAAGRWPAAVGALDLDARLRQLPVATEHGGVRLVLTLRRGTTSDDLRRNADRLASLLRCARLDVMDDERRSDRCSVMLRFDRLPFGSPWPGIERHPVLPVSPYVPLPLGTDEDGEVVRLPLFDRSGGATRILVGGVPGSGKTTAVRTLLAGLAPTSAVLLMVDPTGGAETASWAPRCSRVITTAEAAPTVRLLADVLSLIERRGTLLGAGLDRSALTPVVLVCDELAELAAAGAPKEQEHARTLLRRICALGRKANVAVVMATQRTTATTIDVSTRSLATWRLALAHPDDRHGSEALLGAGRYEAAGLTSADVGVGYLTNGGPPRLLRVFSLAPGEATDGAAIGCASTLDELAAWETAALREMSVVSDVRGGSDDR